MGGPFKLKGMDFGNSPMTQKNKPKDPTYEGTDEYRKKQNITDSEKLHRGVKQEHEGKKTISGDRLSGLVTEGKVINKPSSVGGSTDYYYTMQNGKYKIHGEVDLEGGNVTGVPGSKGGKLTRR